MEKICNLESNLTKYTGLMGFSHCNFPMGFIVVGFYGFSFFLLSMRLPTNFTSYLVHSLVESTTLHVPYEVPTLSATNYVVA